MSKFAVISDIHANLEALTAVFEVIDRESVDDTICLGDVVGYGADPAACLRLIRERNIVCIQGNHDRQMAGEIDERTRDYAVEALMWTREQLSDDDKEFLAGLHQSLTLDGQFMFCHGAPRDPDEYIMHISAMQANLEYLKAEYPDIDICFYGHTHMPSFIGGDIAMLDLQETGTFPLNILRTYLVNPGGVGQPRDKCPKASFLIFDRDDWHVTFHRVEYDVQAARRKIIEAELPRKLAERILVGL